MTTEERLNRIEHVTAAIDEQRRRDHEEDRQLWRDTQRQINELSIRMIQIGNELGDRILQIAEEMRASDQRARTAEQELRDRITGLVSAIGQLTARMGVPPQPPQ